MENVFARGTSASYLDQRRSQHRDQESVVHEVEQLLLNQFVRHLNDRIAKLQRVHEQR